MNKEFSKRLLNWTRIVFIACLFAAMLFAWFGKDTTVFIYIIPSVGGTYGAAIVFYLNKAKMENVFKGKVEFLKIKLQMMQKYPKEQQSVIESELLQIDGALDNKINSTMSDAISEDISINN